MMDFWQHTCTFNSEQPAQPLLIHVVSYQRVAALTCLLNSLVLQTAQNFDVCITHDGFDPDTLHMVHTWAKHNQINTTLKFTSQRHSMWGHPMRAKVVEECAHEYILLTNDDNYYVPVFTQIMMHTMHTQQVDMVMCDMIHSHDHPGGRPQPPYNLFVTEPKLMHCDIGCFITKTQIAQQVAFTHCDQSSADGIFMDRIMQLNDPAIRWAKVPQVLFVHN